MGKFVRPGIALGVCAVFALGTWLGTAVADRSATAPPIVYSGHVLNASGAAIGDGPHMIGLSLWRTTTGATGGLCDMPAAATNTTAGYFSRTLTAACANVFETEEEVYVELTVDSTVIARANARAAAVPYAVTAERIVHASPTNRVSDGTFCGYSATPTPGRLMSGALLGYAAAHALCASGCAGSPTAHMCSGEELVRTLALGATIPDAPESYGWYASGAHAVVNAGAGTFANDCEGYTSSNPAHAGAGWSAIPGASRLPSALPCDMPRSIACCD